MGGVGKDVVAIEVLGFGNATHPGEQALHVIIMTIRRDDLVQVAVTHDHLATTTLELMQVRRIGPDILRELCGQTALLGKKLLLADRSPIEKWIPMNPVAIDLLAEQRRRAGRSRGDPEDALGPPLPTDPHLAAVAVARAIPDLAHDRGFCSCQATCGIRGSAWLTTDRIVGVIMAPSRLLDHAIDDAVDSIASRQSPLVDVLELGRVESVLAELLMGDVVSPAA